MTTSASADGERYLHLLNLDGFPKQLQLAERGAPLFDSSPVELGSRAGLMLPLGVRFGATEIVYATAEIAAVEPDAITFRRAGAPDVVALRSSRTPAPCDDYDLERRGDLTLITSRKPACVDGELVVRLQ